METVKGDWSRVKNINNYRETVGVFSKYYVYCSVCDFEIKRDKVEKYKIIKNKVYCNECLNK